MAVIPENWVFRRYRGASLDDFFHVVKCVLGRFLFTAHDSLKPGNEREQRWILRLPTDMWWGMKGRGGYNIIRSRDNAFLILSSNLSLTIPS